MGSLLFFIIKIRPPWIIVFVGGFRLHMGLSRLLKDYKSKGTDPKVLLIELRNQTQPISIVLQNVLQSPFYLLFSFVFLRWKLNLRLLVGAGCQQMIISSASRPISNYLESKHFVRTLIKGLKTLSASIIIHAYIAIFGEW